MTKSKKRDRVVRLRVRCGAESGSWLKSWRCGVDWFFPLPASFGLTPDPPQSPHAIISWGWRIKEASAHNAQTRGRVPERKTEKGQGKKQPIGLWGAAAPIASLGVPDLPRDSFETALARMLVHVAILNIIVHHVAQLAMLTKTRHWHVAEPQSEYIEPLAIPCHMHSFSFSMGAIISSDHENLTLLTRNDMRLIQHQHRL